jgi:hypothetical protein
MTQASKILWFVFTAAMLLLLPGKAAAQLYVTPMVKPTPPGQLIVVSNGLGANHTDPHVDGDLVCYTDQQNGALPTVRYFNLAAGTDNAVAPSPGSVDFLCDVRGTTIVFTRSASQAIIITFDIAAVVLSEIDPTPNSMRFGGQISDQTIVWADFSGSPATSTMLTFDRTTSFTSVISPSPPAINQNPGISPDGSSVVWENCTTVTSCVVWKAVRSNAGIWNSQQLQSSLFPVAGELHPDTDGAIIAYSSATFSSSNAHIAWQPVSGGTEQVLNVSGSAGDPTVSGRLIAFAYDPTGSGVHQVALYNVAANILYKVGADVLPGAADTSSLNDISVTPDGKVRVVWQQQENGQANLYAYTFNLPVGDFNLGAIAPLAIAAGGSGSTNVSVNPVNGFSSVVNLSVTGQPAGVVTSLSPNSVTPSGGSAATSVLSVSAADFVAPTSFTLTVSGASGSLSHSSTADVTVTATTGSITNLIGDLLNAGCIDNAGIGNALTSKLAAAQSAIGAGNIKTAINILTALKNQINAQAGKHIATSCTIAGVALNPVTALLLDVQGLIDSLRVSMTPDPITGYIVDVSGAGLAGARVSILDAANNVVATAATDITGFYFMATTGVLSPGATYTLQVTGLPAGFTIAPANQTFIWQGGAITFSDFVLN